MNFVTVFLAFLSVAIAVTFEQYPLSELDKTTYKPYTANDKIQLQCIKRQIDNGEHVFDSEGNIVYVPFMNCLESNKPMELSYMKNENVKCTVKFEDEVFHLFQLYLHKDVPLTCRIELRPNSAIYLPVDFSFRGNVLESHFDLDPNLNVLVLTNSENEIVSGTGFSTSTYTTKVIIGQNVELNFNINWLKVKNTIVNEEHNNLVYWLSLDNTYINWILIISGVFLGAAFTLIFTYKSINKKIQNTTWNKVE